MMKTEALRILQAMTPEQKLKAAERLYHSAWQLKAVALRAEHQADFYLSGQDPLHAWGLARARRLEVEGQVLVVAPPEYVILRKLEYYREGGSERHLRDIRSMLDTEFPPGTSKLTWIGNCRVWRSSPPSTAFGWWKPVKETGSGLQGRRKNLLRILRNPKVQVIVVEHRDRLMRFGLAYVEAALAAQGRRVVEVDGAEITGDIVRDCRK